MSVDWPVIMLDENMTTSNSTLGLQLRPATDTELRSTSLLGLKFSEVSAKVSLGTDNLMSA